MRFGPRVGGLFLAFPAILPATLTLLEKKEGKTKACADAAVDCPEPPGWPSSPPSPFYCFGTPHRCLPWALP